MLGTLEDAGKVSAADDVLPPYHGLALYVRALGTVDGAASTAQVRDRFTVVYRESGPAVQGRSEEIPRLREITPIVIGVFR